MPPCIYHRSACKDGCGGETAVGLPPNPLVCCCVMVAVSPQASPHLMASSGGPSLPPPVVRGRAAAAVLPPPVKPRKMSPVAAVAAVYADVRCRPPATQATTMRFRVFCFLQIPHSSHSTVTSFPRATPSLCRQPPYHHHTQAGLSHHPEARSRRCSVAAGSGGQSLPVPLRPLWIPHGCGRPIQQPWMGALCVHGH
jgi:hypothetical protein